jgi:Type I phosphodiesterase / nucleotide pyrophosphatase
VNKAKLFSRKLWAGVALGALAIAVGTAPKVFADPHHHGHGGDGGDSEISHVLLISIDGMHALDYLNCSAGGYCPNLKTLGMNAVNYLDTSTAKPSDSFPGLMALVTGGSPRTMGVNYDVAYDRALNPMMEDTGNGVLAGPCSSGATPIGTRTEYDEGINLNDVPGVHGQDLLNGGAPSGDGGINSIDPMRLVRDKNCNPVYPWNFVRVNTIYGVIHGAGMYTAWSDKHPSYSSVGGPTGTSTDTNVDDYYSPEINSDSSNFNVAAPVQLVIPQCLKAGKPFLPDTVPPSMGDDYTLSFQNIQCYDGLKANAILNEIDGNNHDGTAPTHVPAIFGMNFQAVSIGQKLIYQYADPGFAIGIHH